MKLGSCAVTNMINRLGGILSGQDKAASFADVY
jgi:hypothetical protein